jgi:hypothetical protein
LCAIWLLGEKLRPVALSTKADALLQVLKPERVYVCLFGESLRHWSLFCDSSDARDTCGKLGSICLAAYAEFAVSIKLRKAIPQAEIVEVADQRKVLLDRVEQGGF